MDTDFEVTTDMLVRLCDAVLREELLPDALHAIGFALMASDRFHWDANNNEILADVIADWSCPEVNYQLTVDNVQRFRNWLTKSEPYPAKPPLHRNANNLVSITKKKSTPKYDLGCA